MKVKVKRFLKQDSEKLGRDQNNASCVLTMKYVDVMLKNMELEQNMYTKLQI